MSRLPLCLVFLLAMVASLWDWPEMPPQALSGRPEAGKAYQVPSGHGPQPGQGRRMLVTEPPVPDTGDTLWLRPMATAVVVSDRGGYHVAVGIPDLGELAIGARDGGLGARSAEPATQTAIATWVHRDLHGGKTASQTRYYYWDPYYIASNDYPLGTVLAVSDVFTGVVVDRGNLGSSRLDLSEAGFQRLAPLSQGVARVTVREAD